MAALASAKGSLSDSGSLGVTGKLPSRSSSPITTFSHPRGFQVLPLASGQASGEGRGGDLMPSTLQ